MSSGLEAVDKDLFLVLNSLHFEWLNPLMILISGQIIWIPLIGYLFWLAWNQHPGRPFGLFVLCLLLAVVASDVTSSYILKNVFNRPRPCREADLLPLIHHFGQKCGGKFGFVSSHAANSVALMIFVFSTIRIRSKRWYLLWFMPVLISYSRIYLGVHYPGDIVGGSLVGLSWGMFLAWAFKNSGGKSEERPA